MNACAGAQIEVLSGETDMWVEKIRVEEQDGSHHFDGLLSYICPSCGIREAHPINGRTIGFYESVGIPSSERTVDVGQGLLEMDYLLDDLLGDNAD